MKELELSVAEMLPLMLEVLESGGEFRFYPRGTSMLPLLRQGVDSVILRSFGTIKKNDICLYRRNNGEFVLHRVVKCCKDGTLCFRGDNQSVTECGIRREQVIAKVVAVMRGDTRTKTGSVFYRLTHLSAPARALRFRGRKK